MALSSSFCSPRPCRSSQGRQQDLEAVSGYPAYDQSSDWCSWQLPPRSRSCFDTGWKWRNEPSCCCCLYCSVHYCWAAIGRVAWTFNFVFVTLTTKCSKNRKYNRSRILIRNTVTLLTGSSDIVNSREGTNGWRTGAVWGSICCRTWGSTNCLVFSMWDVELAISSNTFLRKLTQS